MQFVRNKLTICKTVVPLLQEKNIDITVEQAMRTWWLNPRKTGGLGLTESGFQAFLAAELESWDVDYQPKKFAGGFTLLTVLNKKMQCPYCLHRTRGKIYIRIYDSRVYMLINLLGGLDEYLDSLQD